MKKLGFTLLLAAALALAAVVAEYVPFVEFYYAVTHGDRTGEMVMRAIPFVAIVLFLAGTFLIWREKKVTA